RHALRHSLRAWMCRYGLHRCQIPPTEKAKCAHHVLQIVAPEKPGFKRVAPLAPGRRSLHALMPKMAIFYLKSSLGVSASRHSDALLELCAQVRAKGVINVDDPMPRVALTEKSRFGLTIGFHGLVVVQMILSQVRQGCRQELNSCNAILV